MPLSIVLPMSSDTCYPCLRSVHPDGEGAKTSTSSTSTGHHGLSNYKSNQGKFTSTVLYLFSEILSPAYTIKMSSLTIGLLVTMSSLTVALSDMTSSIASPGLAGGGELPVLSIRALTH